MDYLPLEVLAHTAVRKATLVQCLVAGGHSPIRPELALRQITITGGAVESSRPARRARLVSKVAKSSQPAANAW